MLLTIAKILITILDAVLAGLMFSSANDAMRQRYSTDETMHDGLTNNGTDETMHERLKTESIVLNVVGVAHIVNAVLLWA